MKFKQLSKPKYTIWIDQDSVLYDLETPWFRMHNNDHPQHQIHSQHLNEWDVSGICRDAQCNANLYTYLDKKEVWEVGGVIGNSQEIIARWKQDNIAQIGVMTSVLSHVAPSLKMQWLDDKFPFIDRIAIMHGVRKSEMRGDILIDDSPLNLTDWPGIGILYTQPTNLRVNMLRADNWDEVDLLVREAIHLLQQGYEHRDVESILMTRQRWEKPHAKRD